MTDLRKPVTRRTNLPRGRFAVTLYPDGMIGFREHGRRKEYRLPLALVFLRAVEASIPPKRARKATRGTRIRREP
jgi:hypothetical protein